MHLLPDVRQTQHSRVSAFRAVASRRGAAEESGVEYGKFGFKGREQGWEDGRKDWAGCYTRVSNFPPGPDHCPRPIIGRSLVCGILIFRPLALPCRVLFAISLAATVWWVIKARRARSAPAAGYDPGKAVAGENINMSNPPIRNPEGP